MIAYNEKLMLDGLRSFVGLGINDLILDFNPTDTPLPEA